MFARSYVHEFRARRLRSLLAVACFAFGVSVLLPRAAADGTGWFIPRGQEPIVAEILGGERGVGGCRFDSASVRRDLIDVSFACDAGVPAFAIVMRRAPDGACPSVCTRKFQIDVVRGRPPSGFLEALRRRVVEQEPRFRWYRPRGRWWWVPPHALPIGGGVVLALVVVYLLLRRDPPTDPSA